MSDNIVERLRALEAWIRKPTGEAFNMNTDLFDDAADEIERLRAEANDRCPVDAMDRGMTPVEAAVFHVWGERCSDFEPECLTCRAWAEFDRGKSAFTLSPEAYAHFMAVCENPPPPTEALKELFQKHKEHILTDEEREILRLRAALEEIVKPGGADDFWQCVDIARAALEGRE